MITFISTMKQINGGTTPYYKILPCCVTQCRDTMQITVLFGALQGYHAYYRTMCHSVGIHVCYSAMWQTIGMSWHEGRKKDEEMKKSI